MFYAYVLKSNLFNQIYVGSTTNLKERLSEHNKGKVDSTKRYIPWELVYYEAYKYEALARMREKKIKHHGNAIRQLKDRIGLSKLKNIKNSAGFTLIELLVVIAILGILATGLVTIVDPVGQIQKANDARRKSDLAQIQKTLEAYYSDNGRYPYSTGVQGGGTNCLSSINDSYTQYRISAPNSTTCIDWGTNWTAYNTSLPKDPLSTNKYVYNASSDGQTYYLYAHLERGYRDKQNCCPANDQTDTCSCPHAKGGEGWDPDGDIFGAGDACMQFAPAPSDYNNSHAQFVCNYGVSSPNTSP